MMRMQRTLVKLICASQAVSGDIVPAKPEQNQKQQQLTIAHKHRASMIDLELPAQMIESWLPLPSAILVEHAGLSSPCLLLPAGALAVMQQLLLPVTPSFPPWLLPSRLLHLASSPSVAQRDTLDLGMHMWGTTRGQVSNYIALLSVS
jgi:hypothetical protein